MALAFVAPLLVAWAVCSRATFSELAGAREVAAEPTPSVPTDVVFYAHVLYGGDDAYLVEGRWYKPAAGGWAVFTKEPLELAMIRRTVEQKHGIASWLDL